MGTKTCILTIQRVRTSRYPSTSFLPTSSVYCVNQAMMATNSRSLVKFGGKLVNGPEVRLWGENSQKAKRSHCYQPAFVRSTLSICRSQSGSCSVKQDAIRIFANWDLPGIATASACDRNLEQITFFLFALLSPCFFFTPSHVPVDVGYQER